MNTSGENTTTLVVGASGETGKLLVKQLLERGVKVRIVVRPTGQIPDSLSGHEDLSVIYANLLDLSDHELTQLVCDCNSVASCLGHNLTFRGMFGAPRRLVTEATRRLCSAIKANNSDRTVKVLLMNTAGNSNRDLDEPISLGQKFVIALLRLLLPPHVDNEHAADYLRTRIGQSDRDIEWSVVRPDTLLDESENSEFTLHPSPTRSAIFNAGVTSRINVGRFMTDLICDDRTWNEWKGKMPVIYNLERQVTTVKHD